MSVGLRMINFQQKFQEEFLKIEVSDFVLRYDSSASKTFKIEMSDLQLIPYNVHPRYSSILKSLSPDKNLEVLVKYDSKKNQLYFQFSKIKLFFFFRMISEIVEFIDSITS